MTTRIARSTLSEVAFTEDHINEVNDLMVNFRRIFFTDGEVIHIEHASVELVDATRRTAVGVIRYSDQAGLTFTPAAERVIV